MGGVLVQRSAQRHAMMCGGRQSGVGPEDRQLTQQRTPPPPGAAPTCIAPRLTRQDNRLGRRVCMATRAPNGERLVALIAAAADHRGLLLLALLALVKHAADGNDARGVRQRVRRQHQRDA